MSFEKLNLQSRSDGSDFERIIEANSCKDIEIEALKEKIADLKEKLDDYKKLNDSKLEDYS
jgi:hypothetical protein